MNELRHLGRAGEHDAIHASFPDNAGADGFARTRQQLQRLRGYARRMHEANGFRGDERCLLRRFREHRVSRRKRRGDLPGEDRQRKIPGTDAGDHAERCSESIVACTQRIVAAEIGGLPRPTSPQGKGREPLSAPGPASSSA